MPFDTSIFSPDTYHAAILAALRQSAANQDTRYLNMLATMNGMGPLPIPDLQAGIVRHLPDVPLGFNNPHNGPPAATLLPPPIFPLSPDQSRRSKPETAVDLGGGGVGGSNDIVDTVDGPGGGTGGDNGGGPSVIGAPDGPTTVADLSPSTPSETPATLSPDETQAAPDETTTTPATEVATPAQPGFPGWDQVGNPAPNSNFNQNAPPSPPSNPLNEPDVAVAPTEVTPDQETGNPTAPSITVDVNGNQVAPGLPSINDPDGFAAAMAAINSSGLLHSVSNTDMTNPDPSSFSVGLPSNTSVAVNQASKGDSLNAMDVAPTTTVTVAPPDFTAPGFLAPGKSQQEAEQQQDVDTSQAPSPGFLASVFDAITGSPAANQQGNALAAMNAANQAQAEQAQAAVGLMNANTAAINDQAAQNAGPVSVNSPSNAFNVSNDFSSGFNVAGAIPGAPAVAAPVGFMGLGFLGDQNVAAPDLNSANNMNANVAALMDNVNTDFDAPGFEQDASNNEGQAAISAALDQAATNAISQEAGTPSPSPAPSDMATDTSDAGPVGFSGLGAALGLGDISGGDVAGDAAASADASAGVTADAGISADAGIGGDAGVGGDASGGASGDGGW